jgi:hypothetical protein
MSNFKFPSQREQEERRVYNKFEGAFADAYNFGISLEKTDALVAEARAALIAFMKGNGQ